MSAIRVVLLLAGLAAGAAGFMAYPALAENQAQNQVDIDYAKRMFADSAGKPKAYACFVRRYDAEHMAQHPLQKVSVMKLLLTAEKVPDDVDLNYSFRLGVNFRDRTGDFDSSGNCGHVAAVKALDPSEPPEDKPAAGIDFDCGVDCDGGGITVGLAKDNNSVIVKLDRIRIWKGTDPDEAALRSLQGGADDKIFRLDRTSLNECTSLVADRKELAAMRHK
jgi:hypothetical protein